MEKIRLFALAKELGIDNKALVDYCQQLGIVVKNSPLAGISPDERDRVVALIKQGGAKAAPAAEPPARVETVAPVREPVKVTPSKVPALKTMAPRPQTGRDVATPVATAPVPPVTEPELEQEPVSVTPAPEPVVAVPAAPEPPRQTTVTPSGRSGKATPPPEPPVSAPTIA